MNNSEIKSPDSRFGFQARACLTYRGDLVTTSASSGAAAGLGGLDEGARKSESLQEREKGAWGIGRVSGFDSVFAMGPRFIDHMHN